jgi:hypothetical protein
VTVRDERPYVTSGDKPAYFLGAYRAAIGVPWDVTTKGKQPLAALFETHLAVELRSLGYAVVPRPDALRVLDVAIQDMTLTSQDVTDITAGMFNNDLTRGVRGTAEASDRLRDVLGI